MIIYGINTIKGCLEAKTLKKVIVSKDFFNRTLIKSIQDSGVPVEFATKEQINKLAPGVNQGIVGEISVFPHNIDELFTGKEFKNSTRAPIVVMLDSLTDPHNLGAVLRSADAFDVSGVIYKKHNSVSLNSTVAKTSTGAINFVKCFEVTNLTRTIEKLKQNGFWIIGLDGGSKSSFKDVPKDVPLCIVVGSEGDGISRLVKENCDLIVSIPMFGRVNCLNASVACAIALYDLRTR